MYGKDGTDVQVLACIRQWLEDEHKDKKQGEALDTSTFRCRVNIGPPQQNGCDCGMFVLKTAEYRARGAPLTFSQADMAYFRRRTVLELLRGKLLQQDDTLSRHSAHGGEQHGSIRSDAIGGTPDASVASGS